MKAYIVDTLLGPVAYDDDLNIVGLEAYPKRPEDLASKILEMSRDGFTEEVLRLCKRLVEEGYSKIVVEHEAEARAISEKISASVEVEAPSKAGRLARSSVASLLNVLGLSEKEYRRLVQEAALVAARSRIREEAARRDRFVAQAIDALDEIDKSINVSVSRIREWYGLHFPELDDLLPDHLAYVKFVYEIGLRRRASEASLLRLELPEPKAKQVADAARKSMGADVTEADLEPIKELAKLTMDMYGMRKYLETYIADAIQDVAPNIKELVGPLLGARLIALAGGLESLAKRPASTIQVLGAEKALFRALKTGGKPPKHGVIFQHPEIHRSPRWQRGKIARALAAKLSIAARVDAFTGDFIADSLKRDFEARVEEIRKKYAKPPAKRKEVVRRAGARR